MVEGKGDGAVFSGSVDAFCVYVLISFIILQNDTCAGAVGM